MTLVKRDKKSIEIEYPGEDIPDVGNFLLFGLGNTISKLVSVWGSKSVFIDAPGGREIEIERMEEDPEVSFDDRLKDIVEGCMNTSIDIGIQYDFIISRVLVLDGWSWNENVFRSPIWMNDHRDIPIEDARKISGMQWLSGSSLEIKLEPKEG
jgi:hypothetical protein